MDAGPDSSPLFSDFARRFRGKSGILQLMEDISTDNVGKDAIMLGGGNPAKIERVRRLFSGRLAELAENPEEYGRALESYSSPEGDWAFRDSFARMLVRKYGFPVDAENVAVTCGSQSSFYMLFNAFAGEFSGRRKRVLFPLSPEYIGYRNSLFADDGFRSFPPTREIFEEKRRFKYRVDFDRLEIGGDVGAVCVSRPTNPTGNVITDEELAQLDELARRKRVPLIIDNAYGAPLPNLIFKPARMLWNENVILCMSLSKLGLPGARVGVVVAAKPVIRLIASMSASLTLAPTSLGVVLTRPLIEDGRLETLCEEVIVPHYREKSEFASKYLLDRLKGYDCLLHENEGSFFMWLWLRDFPLTTVELYARLKSRGVLVLPGRHFFPGLENRPFPHREECLRINFTCEKSKLARGLEIVAEEIGKVYDAGSR